MPDVLTTDYHVSGMTCGHCEDAVKDEVSALDSVVDVQVDVPAGRVTVTSTTPLDDARVREAIDEAGSERTGRGVTFTLHTEYLPEQPSTMALRTEWRRESQGDAAAGGS